MYLVTTALQEIWPENAPIWLLTPGCAPIPDTPRLNTWDIKGIVPDPFDSAEKTTKSYAEIYKISEQLISVLGQRLNEIHKTSHSEKYWRIHIGFWCLLYVSVIYDRYKRLIKAISSMPGITVIGCDDIELIINANPIDFVHELSDDLYNAKLYTFLCRKLEIPILSQRIYKSNSEPEKVRHFYSSSIKKLLQTSVIYFIHKITLILAKKADIIMTASYLPRWFELALMIKSLGNIVPLIAKFNRTENLPSDEFVDKAARSILSVPPKSCDDITVLIFEMVGICIPKLFVEGYRNLCSASEKIYKNYTPKVIYSANSWWFDEAFKNWAARCGEQGAKLIGGEHGGAPFLEKYKIFESHEISVSDYYLSWGWDGYNEPKVIKSPANKLISLRNHRSKSSANTIIYITTAEARHNVGGLEDFSGLFNWQQRFFMNMPPVLLNTILVRLHYCDYGWNIQSRLLKVAPTLKFDHWKINFKKRLREAKLCIFDYISTTFSESLSANVPTVLFLDENRYPIDAELFPYIQKLKDVHIIHENPESAASWIKKIHDDPYVWWQSRSCQKVVEMFCNLYARTTRNPLKEWISIFENLAKK